MQCIGSRGGELTHLALHGHEGFDGITGGLIGDGGRAGVAQLRSHCVQDGWVVRHHLQRNGLAQRQVMGGVIRVELVLQNIGTHPHSQSQIAHATLVVVGNQIRRIDDIGIRRDVALGFIFTVFF